MYQLELLKELGHIPNFDDGDYELNQLLAERPDLIEARSQQSVYSEDAD